MTSEPGPETIIREQLGHLGPFRGATGEKALDALVRERDQALAENERLRIRYGSFLDWAIGFVSSTVEPEDPEAEWFEIRRSWLQRLEGQLWEERAALAAAQEPPAKGDDRDE